MDRLINQLQTTGFSHLKPEELDQALLADRHLFQYAFDREQDADTTGGRRWRSHSKFELLGGTMTLSKHATYSQSADYNPDHGGLERRFRPIAEPVLKSISLNHLIRFTEGLARQSVPEVFDRPAGTTVGLHMVSYRPAHGLPSYSSPIWLHKDEEAFVAVVLCGITGNLGGGDNVISPKGGGVISDVLRLTESMEMLLLTKRCLHAVTPMYSTDGRPAQRDVLLVTFN